MSTGLISLGTLVEIGFSEEKANRLWDRWTNWPPGPPFRETDPLDGGLYMTFDDFFTGGLEKDDGDAWNDYDEEWRKSLLHYGINDDTQDAIMDPRFKDIRLSRSARYWARDTVEMRYARLQRDAYNSTPAVYPEPSTQSHNHYPEATSVERSSHVTLYKSVDLGRACRLFDDNGNFDCLGRLTSPQSDFSVLLSAFCFSQDYEIAQLEGAYAKRRAPCSRIALISIKIPRDSIQKLQEDEIGSAYWPSPEWKELVWRSRNRRNICQVDALRKFESATLIIGTQAEGADEVYEHMRSAEDITEDCVRMVTRKDGRRVPAIWYVFLAHQGHRFLEEHGLFEVLEYL